MDQNQLINFNQEAYNRLSNLVGTLQGRLNIAETEIDILLNVNNSLKEENDELKKELEELKGNKGKNYKKEKGE